jgi:hypothetical protein
MADKNLPENPCHSEAREKRARNLLSRAASMPPGAPS